MILSKSRKRWPDWPLDPSGEAQMPEKSRHGGPAVIKIVIALDESVDDLVDVKGLGVFYMLGSEMLV